MTRHGLLVTAVVTVTVPACSPCWRSIGHERVAAERATSAAALDGTPLSGPLPVAPATTRAAVRNNVARCSGKRARPSPCSTG